MHAKPIGFGEDGAKNPAFGIIHLDTLEDFG
jgi:hypothetical protein